MNSQNWPSSFLIHFYVLLQETYPLHKRFYGIFYYAFFPSLVVCTICEIMVMNRYYYLIRGEHLTDEQRDLVAAAFTYRHFNWQGELAGEKAWLEEQLHKKQVLNESLTTLHNKSMGISLEKILDQVPSQQNHMTMADELAEPKVAALKAGDEASFSTGAEEMLDESMERFQQLVGYKVQFYISQKSPTFNVTGNLNFWEYFQLQSQYQDLSHLRRSVPLEDDKTIEDVFFLSDTKPVRLSADNQFLLYDSLIDGPDFEQLTHSHKVTIATQTSMDRLFTFIDSYEHWTGPISVAVFLNGPLEYFLLRCEYE